METIIFKCFVAALVLIPTAVFSKVIEEKPTPKSVSIMMIADMDSASVAPNSKWRSTISMGVLTLSPLEFKLYNETNMTTMFSYKKRGAELSDIRNVSGQLVAGDDKTGILFKLLKNKNGEYKLYPWMIVPAENGTSEEGQKIEWMTTKDDVLFVGSTGQNKDAVWVATVSKNGVLSEENWENKFAEIRKVLNVSIEGYIKHEAVQWKGNSWYFLPRKLSNEPFQEKADYCKATNAFVKSDDAFNHLSIVYVGGRNSNYDKCRAYSAFKFLPVPNDNMVVALKTTEMKDDRGNEIIRTYITVFDAVSGDILLNDTLVSDSIKFEGIEIASS